MDKVRVNFVSHDSKIAANLNKPKMMRTRLMVSKQFLKKLRENLPSMALSYMSGPMN